jgi:hypothetical protein
MVNANAPFVPKAGPGLGEPVKAQFCDQHHMRRAGIFGPNCCMQYRGVRYAIRIGIERGQWRVAIHPPGNRLPQERTVSGTREDAEITARALINAWLKKRSVLKE